MSRIGFFLLSIILILGIISCCKENESCYDPTNPSCENYDPCNKLVRPTAKFKIGARIRNNNGEIEYVEDSHVFPGILTEFKSEFDSESFSHKWYLGSEKLNEASFIRDLRSIKNRPSIINIGHVLEYPLDQNCFPDEKGRDSIVQSIYLIKYWDELLTNGIFRMSLENETDSFDFKIKRLAFDGTLAQPVLGAGQCVFINFHNEGDSTDIYSFFEVNDRGYFLDNGFSGPNGFLKVDSVSKIIRAEYKFRGEDFKMNGRKIK